jgi:hypothetical protein
LTANRQEVCRKHAKDNWALDDMVDSSEVLKHVRARSAPARTPGDKRHAGPSAQYGS